MKICGSAASVAPKNIGDSAATGKRAFERTTGISHPASRARDARNPLRVMRTSALAHLEVHLATAGQDRLTLPGAWGWLIGRLLLELLGKVC